MIIHDVEQNSDEWFQLRAGIPTASNFKKLVTSKGEPSKSMSSYAALLAAEKYAGKPLNDFEGNQWTERGLELEADAVSMYEFLYDTEAQEVGFVTNDEKTYGCSPDRFVGEGMMEIKCLKTENHVGVILYRDKYGKCPPDYIQQTQGQMMICGKPWCDVVFYHPVLPMVVIRQTPIDEVVLGIVSQLSAVIKERDEIHKTIMEAQNV